MTPMHSAGQARAACPCAGLAFPCGGRATPMRLAGRARPAPVRRSGGVHHGAVLRLFYGGSPCTGCARSSCKPYFRHGHPLPWSPVACKRCGFESSDVGRRRKKESGDDMRGDRRHERAVMVSARSLPAVSRIPPRLSSPPLLTNGNAAAKPVAVWQMCRGCAAERCPSRFRTI